MDFRIEDAFDTTPERYWEVFLDEEYNEALFEHLDVDRTLVELKRQGTGNDTVIHRTQMISARRSTPKILRRFITGAVTYTEVDVLTLRDNSMQIETSPGALANRVTAGGRYWLDVEGPNQLRRVFEGSVGCEIPLVGGAIERLIIDEMRDLYRGYTEFTRCWLREHPA